MNVFITQSLLATRFVALITVFSLVFSALPASFFVAEAAIQNVTIGVSMVPNPALGGDTITLSNPVGYPVTISQLVISGNVLNFYGPQNPVVPASGTLVIDVGGNLDSVADSVTFSATNMPASTVVSYSGAPATDAQITGSFVVTADDAPQVVDQVKVHIYKYLQSGTTSAQIPNNSTAPDFPMTATWNATNGAGSGNYVLGNNHGGTALRYAADTSFLDAPADYTTSEVTGGESVVLPTDAECVPGKYRLVGYKQGNSIESAQSATLTLTAPVFTDISTDKYVIVVNEKCADTELPPEIINTCLIPNTLGDESEFVINDSGEDTVAEMLALHGYAAIDTTADQINYQVWNLVDPTAVSVTFSMRVLGKRAGNTQIVGYYKAGNTLTFTPVLTQVADTDGEVSISVTIPAAFANTFGFAMQSADKTWYSETALNTDGQDHVAVYNPSANKYLLAFEDINNLGDGDYNDIVIEIDGVTCNPEDNGGNVDTVITGCKFNDLDGDGVREENEPTIPGWEIMLEQGDIDPKYATTGENGCYSFTVEPGSYQVSEINQKGWEQTATIGTGADGDRCYINVDEDQVLEDRSLVSIDAEYTCDFGNQEVEIRQCTYTDNLLTNGSFETPVIAVEADGWNVFDSVINGLAWAVSWVTPDENAPAVAKLELQDGIYNASQGNQYAELDSNWILTPGGEVEGDARVKIEQTIPTTVGQEYTLAFDFSAIPGINGGVLNNSVQVYIGGVLVDTQSADGLLNTNTDWNTFTYNFVASSSSTTIALADAGVADTFGTFVDNVSLVGCEPAEDGGGNDGDGNGDNGDDEIVNQRGGGSSGTRVNRRAPTGEVLGSSTTVPAGLVLGDATSTLPVGAPNTGGGGTAPVTVVLPTLQAVLTSTPKIRPAK